MLHKNRCVTFSNCLESLSNNKQLISAPTANHNAGQISASSKFLLCHRNFWIKCEFIHPRRHLHLKEKKLWNINPLIRIKFFKCCTYIYKGENFVDVPDTQLSSPSTLLKNITPPLLLDHQFPSLYSLIDHFNHIYKC